ncbi:MAG: phage head morphogenesis protein [Zoogloeaceae bacterium]|jgi:hypothetical protein|nr:phage head morphogenesis protein [Zoogloeaceae bacterium]
MLFDLNQPFTEQVEFFRRKLNLGTKRWDDIRHGQHDRSFVVAGVMKADLLEDLRRAVDRGIAEGTDINEFRKDFWAIVEKHGWHGWTGDESDARREWRIRTIFETNLNASYAAGRYAQLTDPDLLSVMPYWRYVHADGVLSPRPQHLAWHGLVLHHKHPFWNTHYPPNGWGCGCTVEATEGPADDDATEPPEGWNEPDARGRLPGIDRGWAYAPGKSITDEMRGIVADKAGKYPEELAQDFLAEMEKGGITPRKAVTPEPTPETFELIAPEKMAKLDGDARTYVLNRGKDGFEYAVAYDARTGKIIKKGTSGLKGKVGIPNKYTQDRNMRIVAHHNHPSASSLSLSDLYDMLSQRGVIRVVVHGADGSQFSATKGKNIGYLAKVAEAASEASATQIARLAQHGLHVPLEEQHLRNTALSRAGIIEYEAKLGDIRSKALYNERDQALIESAIDEIAAVIERKLPK